MLMYDVAERERIFDVVTNNLRSLGIKHRVKRNSRKADSTDNRHVDKCRKIFNVPLSHQPLDEVQLSSGTFVHVPIFVKHAISYLDKYITQEGLFRKAGSQSRQKELVARLDNGNGLGEKYHGIDVANCLKKYFRDLPEPIIPYAYHDLFVRCGMLKISKVEAILLACLLLPSINLYTLAVFMDFLRRVSLYESQNKMTTDNLAKIIGPNLMPLRETSITAMQTRLDAHLSIVKILIENAQRIGVLPKNITDIIQNDFYHNAEMEVDRLAEDRFKEKKKKHRSGSLTRMFNGLKKIVGKNGSPETHHLINGSQSKASDPDPSIPSPEKIPKKRKIVELSIPPASIKKKRNSLDASSTIPPPVLSPISRNPNPSDKSLTVQKCRMRKYMNHVIQPDAIIQKIDKSKILGLNLDRFVSRSRQRINSSEVVKESLDTVESPIERRWSLASSTRTTMKKRKSQNWSASSLIASPSIKRQRELFSKNAGECYDRIFMDADVNLSDESIARDNIDQSIGRLRRRSLKVYSTTKDNQKNTTSDFNDGNLIRNIDVRDEEYVKIPKSEYEEIKNRVSAIETRISQEFSSIIDHDQSKKLPIEAASEVQSEYEKILGEASIGSITSADHLARRLSKELKIRRSAEHKVIRSPSARRIGNLRRRSQDKPNTPRKRVSRTSSWQVSEKNATNHPVPLTESQPIQNNIDSFCSDATNARLSYLHQQLCTLINHTAEHTGSLWSDEENPSVTMNPPKSIGGVRRASSFHGNERTGESNYYNSRIGELRKTNSQQNILHDGELNSKCDATVLDIREKRLSWKNATTYLEYETPTKPTQTPVVTQTGRASIAKLRTQNAGMVLAKAKLFDHNENKNGQELSGETFKIRSGYRRSKESRAMFTPTETSRKKKCKSPKNNGARSKTSQSPNDSSSISHMSQCHSFAKRGNRRPSPTSDQENRRASGEFMYTSRDEATKPMNCKNLNSSSCISTTLAVTRHDTNMINHIGDDENLPATSSVINTPHIKKPLSLKTPKSARSLARRPPIDTRRTPLKAVPASLGTPRRQSPKTTFKSRQITRNININ